MLNFRGVNKLAASTGEFAGFQSTFEAPWPCPKTQRGERTGRIAFGSGGFLATKKSPANFWEVRKVTEIYISFWEDVTLRTLSGGFMCGSLWFNMFGL